MVPYGDGDYDSVLIFHLFDRCASGCRSFPVTEDTFAYVKLANSLYASGNVAEAMLNYRKALALDSQCLEARFMLGNAFAEQEMYREAIRQWRKVEVADPKAPEAKMAHDNVETVYSFFADQPSFVKQLKTITAEEPKAAQAEPEEKGGAKKKAARKGTKTS